MSKTLTLNGKQKTSILLIFLGHEISANIFKNFTDDEMEIITLEIARLKNVQSEVRDQVIDEFVELMLVQEYITQGGISYARELLEKSLGAEKAEEMISKLTASIQVRPFDIVRTTDSLQLKNTIQGEHPQTIALIMAYLQTEKAMVILKDLSPEIQAEVIKRLARMDRTSPEVIREIERILEKKLSNVAGEDFTKVGGIDSVVGILNAVDVATQKTIIESLEVTEPELAEEIKKQMFVFEDIIVLDDRSLQKVLRSVDSSELGIALKDATEELSEKFLRNLSKRAAQGLKDDMEFMGPVRKKDVEEAQQKIVNIVRQLEESGEIIIARGGDDQFV
jgi:flagellar motor switch protein FliG